MVDPIEPDEEQDGTGQEGFRYHLDLDTGDVWEATDDQVWTKVGTIPGSGESSPAGAPKWVSLDDEVVVQPDGTILASVVAVWTHPSDLVTNGMFDTDIAGWTASWNGAGDVISWVDGALQSSGVNNDGPYTDLPAMAEGVEYTLSFDHKKISGPMSAILWDIYDTTDADEYWQIVSVGPVGVWTHYEHTFVALSNETPQLGFVRNGGAGSSTFQIDKVRLAASVAGGQRYELQVSRDPVFSAPASYVTSSTIQRVTPVTPLEPLWLRVRVFGEFTDDSPWSSVRTITPGGDPFAPDVPSDIVAVAGFRLVALKWPRVVHADLRSYQVRWAVDDGSLSGPDTDTWVMVGTLSNVLVVQNLDPETLYWFQVRAVDTSGNTKTSATDATPVPIDTPGSEEAGWSVMVPMQPELIGSTDIAAHSITTDLIDTGAITADMIETGVLTIGKSGVDAIIEVVNSSGDLLGRWDEDGILVLDPVTPGRAVWIAAGEVRTTNAYTPAYPVTDTDHQQWTNSVTAEGINATAITFGISPGGHNNLPNSGFELTPFTNLTNWKWPTDAAWNTGLSLVNANVAGATLTLTSAAY